MAILEMKNKRQEALLESLGSAVYNDARYVKLVEEIAQLDKEYVAAPDAFRVRFSPLIY